MADTGPLDALVDELAERVAQRVLEKLQAGTMPGYVDQSSSPLGRRRHINAVRSGALPGVVLGRRYLAKAEDVGAYLAKVGTTDAVVGVRRGRHGSDDDPVDAVAAELGLIRTRLR